MLAGLLIVAAQVLCGRLSLRHYDHLHDIEPRSWSAGDQDPAPLVSVIVPARNEERNLDRLLASLRGQDYPAVETIVVDDRSTDRTVEVVRRFPAVHLVQGTPPPAGWTGKAHACAQGAAVARGEWLLFVDADTAFAPGAVGSAVTYAQEKGSGFLSLFLQQECASFWERLLLPYAYAQYFAGVPVARINTPGRPEALANGQFMLFRRPIYDAVGGHRAVRASIVDDVEMALVLKRRGVSMMMARGEQLGSVRMYDSLRALWEGFAKNSFSFVRISPRGAPAVVGGSLALGASLPLILRALVGGRWTARVVALAGYAIPAAFLAPWYRRFGVSRRYALAHPLAYAVFQAIVFVSGWRTLGRRGVTWKGRTYDAGHSSTWRPYYHVPRRQVIELGLDIMWGRRRLLANDGQHLIACMRRPPRVEGAEHIPLRGTFCLAANHYQRWGLWIGWEGGIMAAQVAARRADHHDLHLLVIGESRVGPLLGRSWAVPGTAWIYRRVAALWGMVAMPVAPEAARERARALRRLLALALPRNGDAGDPIGLFPEGEQGNAGGLREALPGMGIFFSLLGRRGVPVLPAVMFEDEQGLVVRFGEPLLVRATERGATTDHTLATTVMQRIAALLPEDLRGVYGAGQHDEG